MAIFNELCGWFANNIEDSYLTHWRQEGGVVIKSHDRPRNIDYYFSQDISHPVTQQILASNKVVYRPQWIMDSIHARTRLPLGKYTLQQAQQSRRSSIVSPPSVRSAERHRRRITGTPTPSVFSESNPPVRRFVIQADAATRQSILEGVCDFTPNHHGFVAYKIPKLT